MNQEYIAGGEVGRVNVADKRILNATADVNQLVPFKHKWAWQQYLHATEQQWMPAEVDMTTDIGNLGSFRPHVQRLIAPVIAELKTANNLLQDVAGVGIYRITTSPECRQFLLAANFGSTIRDIALNKIEEDLNLDLSIVPVSDFHMRTELWTKNIRDITYVTDTPEKSYQFLDEVVIQLVRRHVFMGHKGIYALFQSDLAAHFPGAFDLIRRIVERDLQIADFYCNMVVSAMNELGYDSRQRERLEASALAAVGLAEGEQGHDAPTTLGNLVLSKLGFKTRHCRDLPQVLKELYGLGGQQQAAKQSVVQQESTGLQW